MRTIAPKLIPECFKQEEILKRQRDPYKYMTVEQLLYLAEHDSDPEDRWDAYVALMEQVGTDACHELTKDFPPDLYWLG